MTTPGTAPRKGTLVLFRHGQTEYNKLGYLTGLDDPPLTDEGEEQAREAGRRINGIVFDKAFSSTLSRAFNTAALALETSQTQVHLLNADGTWQIEKRKEIAEMDFGRFSGRAHRVDPEILNYKRDYDTPFPGGESERQLVDRVQKFYDDELLPRLLRGENVLVVAHAGIVRVFEVVLGVEQVPPNGLMGVKKRIPNAAPTVYECEDGVVQSVAVIENPKALNAANENGLPSAQPKKPHAPGL